MTGPLAGLRVIEMTGLGPAPLAGQLLADMGAEVICVDRASGPADPTDINRRGKASLAIDLKSDAGRQILRRLANSADILIEGFRPGVMERLGLGPDDLDPRLIYGRMTGWGQTGPLSQTAGHDITYLALTGTLAALGPGDGPPQPPLNLVADFGGGAMFLVMGVLAALVARGATGRGQVVDAAMIDGVPAMTGLISMLRARGQWQDRRQANLLDGGAPFYRCYACACGGYVALGPIEPAFFATFLAVVGLDPVWAERQHDPTHWPALEAALAAHFATRPRDAWAELAAQTDACLAPVLTWDEAPLHPHAVARDAYVQVGQITHAAPAPRFSATPNRRPTAPTAPGADSVRILQALGLDAPAIDQLRHDKVLT